MKSRTTLNMRPRIVIELDEEEARAMEALAGYGIDAFLTAFYKEMGKHYLQPHEAGLRRVFDVFYGPISRDLDLLKKMKETFIIERNND